MAKLKSELKILLLQIREDEITQQEELQEFVDFSGLKENQIDSLNTFTAGHFKANKVQDYDALFVGGSSDASVLHPEQYPFVKYCCKMLRYCYDHAIPVFASCFGFQVAAIEFGGTVILDKANMEMGMYPIQLLPAAKEDILLRDMPQEFWAISGHKERAATLPKNATLLANSALCPFHIFKMNDKPFYAFQFHPEVNKQDLITRLTRYQERYLEKNNALQQIIDNAIYATDEANSLVKRFVDRVLCQEFKMV